MLRTQPKWALLAEALAIVAAIGWADYHTGWQLSLFVFYAVPILLVVWYGNRTAGLLFAVLCGLVWWWANRMDHPFTNSLGYVWASISRLIYFLFVAVGGAALRLQQEASRTRIEGLERTRKLEEEIVRASEHEQRRIGQDLHDGLCQELAAIGCVAAGLRQDLAARAAPESATAAEVEKLLQEAVVQTRNLARGIFPVQMDGEGLAAALEELVANTKRQPSVEVLCQARGEVALGDPNVAMHLYRIAQEALNNAVKHAHARHIVVRLRRADEWLELTITDDGTGLPPASASPTGMGLTNMRYRARLIGGHLEIGAGPGGGTCVSCAVRIGRPKT